MPINRRATVAPGSARLSVGSSNRLRILNDRVCGALWMSESAALRRIWGTIDDTCLGDEQRIKSCKRYDVAPSLGYARQLPKRILLGRWHMYGEPQWVLTACNGETRQLPATGAKIEEYDHY